MIIAVDAMGGDFFPRSPVLGAVKAVNEEGINVVLVGDEADIKSELDRCRYKSDKVEIVHTTEVVETNEPVISALRRKKDSSMRVCYDLHKKGDVQGVVSAGNSGAMLAIGRFVLKMAPGIGRPCLGAILPSLKEKVLLVDAGANINCTPEQLLQFAVLGHVYMASLHSVPKPRIGLLNVGSEPGKGDERSRKTYELLENSSLNFVGNMEGRDFFGGSVDIVLTDGFAGNILLKSVQSAASFVTEIVRQEIKASPLMAKIGAFFMLPTFRRLRKRIDYAEFGGAPLLGLRGNSIICHGRSNPNAIFFGIRFAKWASDSQLDKRIETELFGFRKTLARSA
ncbi:MAG: phosphate acyltransferase PlsX [Proteobacteria bacterium]|nr:phosphate acyltransferase PlsX [Pseudomonadota bacterium]